MNIREFDLTSMLEKTTPVTGWGHQILCPCCGDIYALAGTPKKTPGNDNGEAGWGGRGDLLSIPFESHCCGGAWTLHIGFHKGSSFMFIEVNNDCRLSEIDVDKVFGDTCCNDREKSISCPYCGNPATRQEGDTEPGSRSDYASESSLIPFVGECGSRFFIGFNWHKGHSFVFAKGHTDCRTQTK